MKVRGPVGVPRRWARHAIADDSGTVTAEFAVVVPVVVLLVVATVSALSASMESIRLQDAAGIVARASGREDGGAAGLAARLVPRASLSFGGGDGTGLACATLAESVGIGGLAAVIPLTATSCAPTGGE